MYPNTSHVFDAWTVQDAFVYTHRFNLNRAAWQRSLSSTSHSYLLPFLDCLSAASKSWRKIIRKYIIQVLLRYSTAMDKPMDLERCSNIKLIDIRLNKLDWKSGKLETAIQKMTLRDILRIGQMYKIIHGSWWNLPAMRGWFLQDLLSYLAIS